MSDESRSFTPWDLAEHAEMVARAIAGPGIGSHDEVTLESSIMTARSIAAVIVRLKGRPPLRITLEEVR
jgi:hypothetical protein